MKNYLFKILIRYIDLHAFLIYRLAGRNFRTNIYSQKCDNKHKKLQL